MSTEDIQHPINAAATAHVHSQRPRRFTFKPAHLLPPVAHNTVLHCDVALYVQALVVAVCS
jgi:hypothetical protein